MSEIVPILVSSIFQNLDTSSHMFESLVSKTVELGEGFKPELYESDLPVLEQQLETLKDKFQRYSHYLFL